MKVIFCVIAISVAIFVFKNDLFTMLKKKKNLHRARSSAHSSGSVLNHWCYKKHTLHVQCSMKEQNYIARGSSVYSYS